MHIDLKSMTGEIIARVPVTQDEHGYLYAEHASLQFEVDCALYGYQEGGVNSDTIEDSQTGDPYVQWELHE